MRKFHIDIKGYLLTYLFPFIAAPRLVIGFVSSNMKDLGPFTKQNSGLGFISHGISVGK